MPYAVTLLLDVAAAARVKLMWRALAEQAGDDGAIRLGYAPHITLAVLPETASAKVLEDAAGRVARTWDAMPIILAGLGVFPGTPPVIWAAPVVTAGLLARHEMLHTALAAYSVHPHYRPGAWVPHVTLSQRGLCSVSRAVEIVTSAWEGPISGSLDRIDLVRFLPVSVLWSAALSPQILN